MADQLPQVNVNGRSAEPDDGTVEELLRRAATSMGRNPDDPETQALIQKQIASITESYPGMNPDQRAAQAGSNAAQLAGTFQRPVDSGVDPQQYKQINDQRNQLASRVNADQQQAQVIAPLVNQFSTANGDTGAQQRFVDSRALPLQQFDANQEANEKRRTANIEAVGKNQKNLQEGFATNEAAMSNFNNQLNNNPDSPVSKVSVQTAQHTLKQFGFNDADIAKLNGMNKTQVDQYMNSAIKFRMDNAKSDAERKNILAQANQANAATKETLAQARQQAVRANFYDRADANAKQNPGQPNPAALSDLNTPIENARQQAVAQRNAGFSQGVASRDSVRNSISDVRDILSQGQGTGIVAGSALAAKFNSTLQVLQKDLANIARANGVDAAQSNIQAQQTIASLADSTKKPETIKKILNTIEGQMDRQEKMYNARQANGGQNFNEDEYSRNLRTYTFTDPKTGKSFTKTVDRNSPDWSAEQEKAMLKKNAAYNPVLTGYEGR